MKIGRTRDTNIIKSLPTSSPIGGRRGASPPGCPSLLPRCVGSHVHHQHRVYQSVRLYVAAAVARTDQQVGGFQLVVRSKHFPLIDPGPNPAQFLDRNQYDAA